jgi:asparagine synthase (glutamine-hydrolysing)
MCGIAGFVGLAPSPPRDTLVRMTEAIAHRGPDDSGFYLDDYAALGHRRLSIIDLSGGHQPLSNATGSLWITYNGEIFNHASLRPELEQAGHRYASHCDTETVVHAYEEYGEGCVERFRGMFAFALWDKNRRVLFCARDRLGIKPFYYFWNGRVFAFASEIKALLEHPEISPALEASLLPEYLAFGYTAGERTMFAGIRKLMPGHTLTLDLRKSHVKPAIRRYWDVPVPGKPPDKSDTEWIAECRERVETSVHMRLMSDVPLGLFLSGGVDSSAIAAIVRRQTSGPVKTFSVGYAEQSFSELSYAAQVARAIGTDHHEVVVGMEDFFQALPRLIWHEDEPIAWPSSVALNFVSKLASQQVKVVLAGEGSDEIFGGYRRYRWNLMNQRYLAAYRNVLPGAGRRWVRSTIGSSALLSAQVRRKLGRSFLGRGENMESLYLDSHYSAFSSAEQRALRANGDTGADAIYSQYLLYFNAWPNASPLQRMLYADQKTYLVELLMKQDQMSMACSLESRVPFLDHTLVEFAMTVPDRLKIHGSAQKYIFKEAVRGLLPPEILYRGKMGFPTPISRWLLDPRAEPIYAALVSPDGFLASYLDLNEVRALLDRHRGGVEDSTDRVWRLLNLQLWGDLFLTGRHERWWGGIAVGEVVPR